MSAIVKIGILGAIAVAIYYGYRLLTDKVSQWTSLISVQLTSVGVPSYKNATLTLPVTLTIQNGSPLSIPIRDMRLTVMIMRGGIFEVLGKTDPSGPFQIKQGANPLQLVPHVDISKLWPSKTTGQNIFEVLANKSALAQLKAIVDLNIEGYSFQETAITTITLNDLIKSVA